MKFEHPSEDPIWMDRYSDTIPQILKEDWVLEELADGTPMSKVLEQVWAGYEKWVDEQIEDDKRVREEEV